MTVLSLSLAGSRSLFPLSFLSPSPPPPLLLHSRRAREGMHVRPSRAREREECRRRDRNRRDVPRDVPTTATTPFSLTKAWTWRVAYATCARMCRMIRMLRAFGLRVFFKVECLSRAICSQHLL